MKATLEFYVDKPVEYRRLKMAMEAEQAFSVLLRIEEYCKHQRARFESTGQKDRAKIYNNIILCLKGFLTTYEISMKNYTEIESILRGQESENRVEQVKR